ncbi:hypothetical protein KY285_015951 [Solanum tuberosum]|nr:hypothetical protein KY285_015951 [Solanum tuberosum]
MHVVDPKVFLEGPPTITRSQQLELIATIRREELYTALKGIDELKTPGVDGFNSCFFIKAWPAIGGDALEFFTITLLIDFKGDHSEIANGNGLFGGP